MTHSRRLTFTLSILLAASLVKLWLLPLPSSFWVDEMVTAFVVHQGAAHLVLQRRIAYFFFLLVSSQPKTNIRIEHLLTCS